MVGVMDTTTGGSRVTVAVAVLLGSALLVAVTVAKVCVLADVGAVYRPEADTTPADADQVTRVSDVPVTSAVNCCD